MFRSLTLALVSAAGLAVSCGPSTDIEVSVPGVTQQGLDVTTVLAPTADTHVRRNSPFSAYGLEGLLRVGTSDRRKAAVGFDSASIAAALQGRQLVSARLELFLGGGVTNFTNGQALVAQPLGKPFVETRATYRCANDTQPTNWRNNCATSDVWSLEAAPFPWRSTGIPVPLLNGRTGTVVFDVTGDIADVQAGLYPPHGWMVLRTNDTATGDANFRSREDVSGPRLVIVTTTATAVCGNGVLEGSETCDDGNNVPDDGCSACAIDFCGDALVNNAGTEQCDDGNEVDADGCSACVLDVCGDALVNNGGTEQCDDGNQVAGDGCSACAIDVCGDALVNNAGTEQCDDGNGIDADGCSACALDFCGDALVNNAGSEQCDDGNDVPGDGCSACVVDFCGDALANNAGTEQCDDGNGIDADGCSACVLDFCGDALVNNAGSEQCDDGNDVPGDGCSACVVDYCGDALVNNVGTEQCDDGNQFAGDGCSTCIVDFCGDALVNNAGTEQCDDGNAIAGDGCSACVIDFCGDALVNNVGSEQCDDGNAIVGDGCSACVVDFCGDALVNNAGTEQCDDGNATVGDGCSACVVDFCGDALVNNAGTEQCDDGNGVPGDGCSTCIVDFCGDALVNNADAEQCDDGNGVDADGCTSCVVDFCGDATVNDGVNEACDDGNGIDGDGCTSCITDICGDGVVNNSGGEDCDDGNHLNGDECSSTCRHEYIFFSDSISGIIYRSSRSGSNRVAIAAGGFGGGVGIDTVARKVYFSFDRTVERTNFDGTDRETVATVISTCGIGVIRVDGGAGKVYWAPTCTSVGEPNVSRMNLDGSQLEGVIFGFAATRDIQIDTLSGKLYWNDSGSQIYRSNLDGSNPENIVLVPVFSTIEGFALDLPRNEIYFTDKQNKRIRRTSITGGPIAPITNIITTGLGLPFGLAIDRDMGKLYWADWTLKGVFRSDLDGSNREAVSTVGLSSARSIVVY